MSTCATRTGLQLDGAAERPTLLKKTVGGMLKRSERNLIVGLDIGTSKVVALVGEIGLDGSIEVLGIGSQPSRGLKKGVVVNIESTVQSIQRAAEEADQTARCASPPR